MLKVGVRLVINAPTNMLVKNALMSKSTQTTENPIPSGCVTIASTIMELHSLRMTFFCQELTYEQRFDRCLVEKIVISYCLFLFHPKESVTVDEFGSFLW